MSLSARQAAWFVLRLRLAILFRRWRWGFLVLVVIALLQGQREPSATPPRYPVADSVSSPVNITLEPAWKHLRAGLHEAHALRRAGRATEAIRRYSTVISAPGARLQDVQSARAWRARLCFERGENSALDELMALVQEPLAPQLYAHVASTVTGIGDASSDANDPVTRASVFAATVHQLERASRVRGASGERAKRWLSRVRLRGASFFSR